MSGLIQSAKQRLWDVVNELNRAQPRPDLRVAVLSYGDPRYGALEVELKAELEGLRRRYGDTDPNEST